MTDKDRADRILRALESIAKSLGAIEKKINEEDAPEDESGSEKTVGFQAPGKDEGKEIQGRRGNRDIVLFFK